MTNTAELVFDNMIKFLTENPAKSDGIITIIPPGTVERTEIGLVHRANPTNINHSNTR